MAERLFKLAAQQGHASAMVSLCLRAKEYYDQAAQLGYANAQYNLGCLYAIGNGVPKNE